MYRYIQPHHPHHPHHHHHHQSVLPKGRSFTANLGTKAAVLFKGRSSTINSGTKAAVLLKGRSSTAHSGRKVAVLLGMNRCSSFRLLSASHCLFSIWTDLKRSEKIPGAPVWRWGEWIWLTGPSGLHRNSPQRLNISSISVFDRSEIRKSQSPFAPHNIMWCNVIYHHRHQCVLPKGRSFTASSGT